MAQPHRAMWLPPALLLLWVPGCLSLSGPHRVRGIVGGSLSVECRYQEKFRNNNKYWCKNSCLLSPNIVATTESKTEVTQGHVSIRDHPANLTFTVTLESLREEDAGTYRCGIDVSYKFDPTFEVEVSVTPAPRPTRPTVTVKTSTITTKVSTVSFTTLATEGTTHSTSSQEEYDPTQTWSGRLSTEQEREGGTPCPTQPTLSPFRLHALLISLALLLLLLGGISLLAWRADASFLLSTLSSFQGVLKQLHQHLI